MNRAAYGNKNDGKTGDVLMLECHLHDHLGSYWSVVVHEMTHMIQDYKRMRVSRRDMEMDAHFAQSLYRKRSKGVDKANSEAVWKFDPIAQSYIDDDDYLNSIAFRMQRGKLRSSLNFHYGKHSDLTKKKRQDGVIF
ncbi:MAG: hypothetical protein AAFU85_30295 [Planctomycetota bacterium]